MERLFSAARFDAPLATATAALARHRTLGLALAAAKDGQAKSDSELLLACVHDTMLQTLRAPLYCAPVIATSADVLEFLFAALGAQRIEVIWAFYLDAANHLLSDEAASLGTVARAVFHPRELLRRALELGATGIILAHNHPSGASAPSTDDVAMTNRLIRVAREMDIVVHDHLVVTNSGWTSLRAEGLLFG